MSNTSQLSQLIEPIREMIHDLDRQVHHATELTDAVAACFSCDFLPFEILSASNIYPFVMPGENIPASAGKCVAPGTCCRFAGSAPSITVPSLPAGYGEPAIQEWEKIVDDVVARITGTSPARHDRELLATCTEKYNVIRRTVRGIAALRREKPSLLSNSDLQVVFDAALCLPPEILRVHLAAILDALNSTEDTGRLRGVPAMVYGSFAANPSLFDELETAGFLVVEDDTCRGRRSFDLSHDASSPDLYREILNAHSFRPFCPCLRGAGERFDLLYRLAASYGIETVILVDDDSCPARKGQIGEMKVRLMRAGLDPLVVTPGGAVEAAAGYIKLASL